MTAVREKKGKLNKKAITKKNSSEKNVLRIMTYSTNNYIYIHEPKPFTKLSIYQL